MNEGEKYIPYRMFHEITVVPDWLYQIEGLSSMAKLLWGRLYRYCGPEGNCFPSEETLAKDLGVDPRQIRKLLESLERNKLIEIQRPENLDKYSHITNKYYFLWHRINSIEITKTRGKEDFTSPEGFSPSVQRAFRPLKRNTNKTSFYSSSFPPEKNPLKTKYSAEGTDVNSSESTPLKRRIPFLAPKEDQTPHKLDSGLRPTKDVVDIISFWNSSNGLPHMTVPNSLGEPHTKSYERCCVLLRSALHGNFFSSIKKSDKDRILSKKEIITAIDRFKLSATSLDYKPVNKNNIRRTTLNNFLHNPYSSIEESYFEQFLVQEPELLRSSAKPLDDPNPAYSEWLREAYEKYVLLGQKPEWNQVDLNRFIEGGKKMKEAAYKLRTKIIYTTDPATMVFSLVKALSRTFVGHVGLGHISSSWTYNVLLPQVLTKMGQMDTTIYPDE